MPTTIKPKLGPKDLGNPKSVTVPDKMDDPAARKVLGRIVGIATGIKTGVGNNGQPYVGLKGSFEAQPADASLPRVRAGVCFLPPGIAEMVATKLAGENAPDSVQMAFDITAVKAANPIGYSYEVMPLIEVSETDPLEQLLALPQLGGAAQITDQSAQSAKPAKKA